MTEEAQHKLRAEAALAAATALRADHPAWALVPLFYSAFHVMHACFERDQWPADERLATQHKSLWRDGARQAWGTTDVVRKRYPRAVSQLYSSLFDVGYAVRYKAPPLGDGARFWSEYDRLRQLVGA